MPCIYPAVPSPLNSKPDFCSNQAHNSNGKEHLISENAFFCNLMKLGWPPPLREGLNWCKLDYLTTHPDKDRHYNHFLHHHHHPPPLNFLKPLNALSYQLYLSLTIPLPPQLPTPPNSLLSYPPPPLSCPCLFLVSYWLVSVLSLSFPCNPHVLSLSCPCLVPVMSCPYLVPVWSLTCYLSPFPWNLFI